MELSMSLNCEEGEANGMLSKGRGTLRVGGTKREVRFKGSFQSGKLELTSDNALSTGLDEERACSIEIKFEAQDTDGGKFALLYSNGMDVAYFGSKGLWACSLKSGELELFPDGSWKFTAELLLE